MDFQREYHEKMLDTFQDSMNVIRKGRADGLQINLEQRSNWRNSIMTICFGVSAAFLAVGRNLTLAHHYMRVSFWIGATLFLVDGLYIILYVKHVIDDDSNKLIIFMTEEEYAVGKLRNLFRNALRSETNINPQEFHRLIGEFKVISGKTSSQAASTNKRVLIIDDIWVFILLLAFYFLSVGLLPLPGQALPYIIFTGILLSLIYFVFSMDSYKQAKSASQQHIDWKAKLDSLNE